MVEQGRAGRQRVSVCVCDCGGEVGSELVYVCFCFCSDSNGEPRRASEADMICFKGERKRLRMCVFVCVCCIHFGNTHFVISIAISFCVCVHVAVLNQVSLTLLEERERRLNGMG